MAISIKSGSSWNTKAAFRAHAYLTILTMALATAYQYWMDQQDKLEHDGQDTGIRKFREKVKEENGIKLIIFDQDRYTIFNVYEVFILLGSGQRGLLTLSQHNPVRLPIRQL